MTKQASYRIGGYDRQKWRWDSVAYGGKSDDSVFGPAVVACALYMPVRYPVTKRLLETIDGGSSNSRTDLVIAVRVKMRGELRR